MSNTTTTTEDLIGAYVRLNDEEDQELYVVESYNKGWYRLELREDRRIFVKARRADFEVVDDEEMDEIAAEDEAPEDEGESKMSGTLAKYRPRYVPTVAASGKKSLHTGDAVSLALEYRDWEAVMAICADLLELDLAELQAKYAHLNKGARRMNCGNRIRAAYKKGDAKVVEWVNANQPSAK